MNVITRPTMTLEEFLAWEREQECAHEFDGERVIPMNGGTISHYLIAYNLGVELHRPLAGSPFQVIPAGVKLVHAGRVRYPYLVVAPAGIDTTLDVTPEPIIAVEIVSPSSKRRDMVTKPAEYGAIPPSGSM